jgi:hypothetical protein
MFRSHKFGEASGASPGWVAASLHSDCFKAWHLRASERLPQVI